MSTIPTKEEAQAVRTFLAEAFVEGGKLNLTEPQIKEFGAWLLANPNVDQNDKARRYTDYRRDNIVNRPTRQIEE